MSSNDETHALLDQLIAARKSSNQIRFIGVAVMTAMFAFFATMVYSRIQNFDSATLSEVRRVVPRLVGAETQGPAGLRRDGGRELPHRRGRLVPRKAL